MRLYHALYQPPQRTAYAAPARTRTHARSGTHTCAHAFHLPLRMSVRFAPDVCSCRANRKPGRRQIGHQGTIYPSLVTSRSRAAQDVRFPPICVPLGTLHGLTWASLDARRSNRTKARCSSVPFCESHDQQGRDHGPDLQCLTVGAANRQCSRCQQERKGNRAGLQRRKPLGDLRTPQRAEPRKRGAARPSGRTRDNVVRKL
jgi:hypothetical protein